MKRRFVAAVIIAIAAGNLGCMTLAKQGFKEMRGARGKTLEIHALNRETVAACRSVHVGEIVNEIGDWCPPDMVLGLQQSLPERLAELDEELGGGSPRLYVDLHIQYAQKGGGIRAVLGKDQYLVGRVYLRDDGGARVAELVTVAHSEAISTGDEDMGEAAAEAIADYVRDCRKPLDEDESEDEDD